MKRHRFHPGARAEFRAAVEWYRARSEMAGEFAAAVEGAIKRIRRSPAAYGRWPDVSDEVRRCVLRRFPFVVIYTIDSKGILILALAHTSRDPTYWMRRLAP